MMKAFLILIILIGAWMYFTKPGKEFFEEHVAGEPEKVVDPEEPARRALTSHLEAQIREKEIKIEALTREMQFELSIRAKRLSTPLRTDPIFLERSIKRLEEEKMMLEARLPHGR